MWHAFLSEVSITAQNTNKINLRGCEATEVLHGTLSIILSQKKVYSDERKPGVIISELNTFIPICRRRKLSADVTSLSVSYHTGHTPT